MAKQLIKDEKARSLTYKKRMISIKKKTTELATLCGIEVCAIVFGPDGEIDSWPENPADARAMIGVYKDMYSRTLKSTEASITETGTRRDANSDDEKIANLEREIADAERENRRKIMRLMEAMNHALSDRIELLKAVDDERRSKTEEKKADSLGKDINGEELLPIVVNSEILDLAPDLRVDLEVQREWEVGRVDHLEVQREWEVDRVLAGHRVAQEDHQSNLGAANNSIRRRSCNDKKKKKK
ncbi:hypothetical protein RHGRI_012472 [Rhododendron griersonianum]|uniref:MADS-box domain-containing protein n=1 Tax=Rhododendron griersonianum TaxID=479676 RepID=A0AAV6KQZ0_9ERIC|nr:hypothetical protein RHGRI_012472 [Rhododendron griersonianum]